MNTEFFNALDLLQTEKGIPKEYMLEKVEAALVTAFKKERGNGALVRVVLDPEKKEVKVFEQKNIVEEVTDPTTEISLEAARLINRRYTLGGVAETELKTKSFGRISAQTAKQVIIQGIREAERGMLIREYESKQEEIVSARIESVDPETGNALVDTGTSNAVLLRNEQIPGEILRPGEYTKVYVIEVRKESKGPIVTLSRTHPGLLRRLFELEVPEIQDGTVIIENITREAGRRSKMAVYSRDENVDPVGACIGNHGIRINRVVEELCGERVDIIKYNEDPAVYIAAALSPAAVLSVDVNEEEHAALVYVAADQLSLAIGKEGQNARLAARLTGYKVDIKSK